LILNVSYDTTERLHVHIFDAAELQWQVPSWLLPRPSSATNSTLKTTSDLSFNYTSSPFEWWITRRSTSDILFDTRNASMPTYADVIPASELGESGIVDDASYHNRTSLGPYPFVFEDQYLQVTSKLPLDANIYGLGYAVSSSGFRRNNTATVQAGWAADRGDNADSNICSSHFLPPRAVLIMDAKMETSHSTSSIESRTTREHLMEYSSYPVRPSLPSSSHY
jgi:alpha-glucosidase